MSDAIQITCAEPVQGHQSIQSVLWPWIKAMTIAGNRVTVRAEKEEDQRSLQQLKFYWKACLEQISQQATLGGVGFQKEGWHWYMKRKFLGYKFKKVQIPGNKRVSVIKELRSTRGLSVKKMSDYLDKVQAHAAQDLGVEFTVRDWTKWANVDPETGEIT